MVAILFNENTSCLSLCRLDMKLNALPSLNTSQTQTVRGYLLVSVTGREKRKEKSQCLRRVRATKGHVNTVQTETTAASAV